jgi:hypothetical protein
MRGQVMANGSLRGWAAAVLAASAFTGGAALGHEARPAHSWRIEVSEGANSDGTIRFVVTPVGGEITTVAIPIKKGRAENDVAKDLRDGFISALPTGGYEVEVDDGEDVLVKTKDPAPKFSVIMIDSTVKGTRVNVEHD